MPFAANLQSFPWIPTRLALLFLPPSIAYAPAVALAAALSALFTFLYCRRAGLSRTAAWAAAGTFACAGYFASRVMAGHLPLLEAYPALPLLLWLVDRALSPDRHSRRRFDLGVLASSSAFVAAAGHPQLPAYALASAVLYTLWRSRGRLRARVLGTLVLGAGLTLAAWWPMLLLVGRSTRVLHLAPSVNDVAMPYARLLALLIPGIHGWPEPVKLAAAHPFGGFPNASYFWDTADYIGILPLIAIAALLTTCIVRRRMLHGRWLFLALLGTGSFLGSLPLANSLLHLLPGTLFRSPARLLYLSTFCVAVSFGVALDLFRSAQFRGTPVLLPFVLSLHFLNLWGFTHLFIQTAPLATGKTPVFQNILDREVGDGRIAGERDNLDLTYADRYDDAGGFDSILLARVYQGLVATAGIAPGANVQEIDASTFPVKALEATGVRFVITTDTRDDLPLAASTDDATLCRVPNPAPRVHFAGGDFHYERPSSDEILVQTNSTHPGSVELLEAFDPGWTATVDGAFAPVTPVHEFSMAVPVPAGAHRVRVSYHTPGRVMGLLLSALSLVLLIALIASASQQINHPSVDPNFGAYP
jgi:hypothetical protein